MKKILRLYQLTSTTDQEAIQYLDQLCVMGDDFDNMIVYKPIISEEVRTWKLKEKFPIGMISKRYLHAENTINEVLTLYTECNIYKFRLTGTIYM